MSKSEEIISRSLRTILADLPRGAHIHDSGEFRNRVLTGLDFFLPEILREIYNEWKGESLDGIYPVVARKTGEGEIEIFGQCILISDQTLVPIHLSLQIDMDRDEVSWLLCKLGEKLQGTPGETGKYGMRRLPYSCLDRALSQTYRLDGTADKIDWGYKVTFGERRP